MKCNWIDFNKLPKYKKKLPPIQDYDEACETLNNYFKDNSKYSLYSLALAFNMSRDRFVSNYLKSKDNQIKELIDMSMTAIASHALDNADTKYIKSLRYIMARVNTDKDFIELSDEVLDATKDSIIILPAKK